MQFDAHDALMGLVGGLMIGTAAAVFLLGLGRIAGVSGIAASLLRPSGGPDLRADTCFLLGLVAGPLLLSALIAAPSVGVTGDPLLLAAGGLLVGYGARLGGGCTSGHGVCGVARLSPRSVAATIVFLGTGVLAASVIRPMLAGG